MRKLIVLAFVCLLVQFVVADEAWKLHDVKWGVPTDSVRLNVYSDGALEGTALKTGVQSWDTLLYAKTGKLNQVHYLIYYSGSQYPLVFPFTRNLKRNVSGGYTWSLVDMRFPSVTDSAAIAIYRDTTQVGSGKRIGSPTEYDTAFTAYALSYNSATVNIWYPGQDSATSWHWVWDLTDTASSNIATPGVPLRCRVYGTVMDASGTKIYGALVTAVRRSGDNATGTTTSNNVILSGEPTYAVTDRDGLFSMYLIGTGQFVDTTRGFYDITCEYGGQTVFKLNSVWLPSAGNVNVADSLSLRNN